METIANTTPTKEPYSEMTEYLKIQNEGQRKLVEFILKSTGKFMIAIKDSERFSKNYGTITIGPKQSIDANNLVERGKNIKSFNFGDKILLLGCSIEYIHSGYKEILIYGLFEETYLTIPVELEKFEREFAIVVLPEPEIILKQNENKDSIDRWLESQLKICGRLFQSAKNIHATRGPYISYLEEKRKFHPTEKKTFGTKTIYSHSKIIGLGVYRNANQGKIVFEFIFNGEMFWWEFNQKKVKTKGIIFEDYWSCIK